MPKDNGIVVDYSAHDIGAAIKDAVLFLPGKFNPRHEHSKRCYRVLEHILYNNEYTVIEAKQSLMKSISPTRIVATNQRIILVKPSFWSLWAGHNIFSPTRYEVIPYSNVANITLLTGMFFSTVSIFLTTGSTKWDGDIEGLKIKDAKAMFIFIEKMNESLRKQQGRQSSVSRSRSKRKRVDELNLHVSKDLVKYKGSKFVWLGVHPLEYAAEALGTAKNSVMRMNMEEIAKMTKADAVKLEGHILVCYDGNFASYVSDYIKEIHGVHTYVLSGGIDQYSQDSKLIPRE